MSFDFWPHAVLLLLLSIVAVNFTAVLLLLLLLRPQSSPSLLLPDNARDKWWLPDLCCLILGFRVYPGWLVVVCCWVLEGTHSHAKPTDDPTIFSP